MAGILDLFSRRNILLGLGGATAATVGTVAGTSSGGAELFAQLLRPGGRGRRGVALRNAERDDWSVQVGSLFRAETGHVLKLADVQGFPERSARPKQLRDSAFVARFDITSGGPLPGDLMYRVRHGEGGEFNLFLAAGDPAKPLRMLAVFN